MKDFMTQKFSKEGSRIAIYSYDNRTLALLRSSDGAFLAGNKKIGYSEYTDDLVNLPNFEVIYNNSTRLTAIYG